MKKLASKPAAQRMRYGDRSVLGFSGTAAATGVSDGVAVGVVSVRGLTVISSDIRVRGGCGDSQSLNVEPLASARGYAPPGEAYGVVRAYSSWRCGCNQKCKLRAKDARVKDSLVFMGGRLAQW